MTSTLLAKLALEQHARQWRFRCPACGYRNALSIRSRPKRSLLLYCFNGCTQGALHHAVGRIGGAGWKPPAPLSSADLAADQAKKRASALKLWAESTTLAGTIGETYLARRKLPHLVDSKALRFHGDVSHPGGGRLPAMVAQVVDAAGSPVAVHRTYLAPDGCGKADVIAKRASLASVAGGVIRVTERKSDGPLVIGEGIETCASAGVVIGAPAWAAIFAGNLEHGLALPPEVAEVIIAVDPDPPGRKAARAAGQRWRREGRRVHFAYPAGSGDFNDALCAQMEDAPHG